MIISIISNHLPWLLTNFVISFLYGNWDCSRSLSHWCLCYWIIDLGNFPTEQKHSFLFRKGLRVIGQPLLSTNNNILIPHGPVINDTYTYNNLVGRLKMKSFHVDDSPIFPPNYGNYFECGRVYFRHEPILTISHS